MILCSMVSPQNVNNMSYLILKQKKNHLNSSSFSTWTLGKKVNVYRDILKETWIFPQISCNIYEWKEGMVALLFIFSILFWKLFDSEYRY